jgi:PAS domain-containing protein
MSDFAGMDHEFQLENTNDSDFLDDDQFHLTLEALAEDEEPSERRVAAVETAPVVPLAAPVQPTAAATTATTDWSVPWIMAQLQQEMMRQQPWLGVLASTTTTAVPLWNAAAPPVVWPNTGLTLPSVSAPADPLPTALAASVASLATSTVSGTVASAPAPLRTAAPAPRKRKRKEPRHHQQPTSVVAWDDEEDEDHSHISENEDESAQRRRERNAREQARSQHITTQIAQLRTVLEDAQVPFKGDKYSTLTTVVDYIRHLQTRAALLQTEHAKLLAVISQTSALVNGTYTPQPRRAATAEPVTSDDDATVGLHQYPSRDDDATAAAPLPVESASSTWTSSSLQDPPVLVLGLDYQAIFGCSPVPFAVCCVDGRLLDANQQFCQVTGFGHQELLPNSSTGKTLSMPQEDEEESAVETATTTPEPVRSSLDETSTTLNASLFNVITPADMPAVFAALSALLQQPPQDDDEPGWHGTVSLSRSQQSRRLDIALVRTTQGKPRFFICSLTPPPG